METKQGPKLLTYAEHKKWHADRQQVLIDVAADFKFITGREPASVLELIGWNASQSNHPENPPEPPRHVPVSSDLSVVQ